MSPSLSPSVSPRWPQSGGSPSASGEGQWERAEWEPCAAPAGRTVSGPGLRQQSARGCEGPVPLPCREHLEEERLSDGRYQLQRLPGGRVALPVLEEKLSQLCLPPEMPCELVRIQGRPPPDAGPEAAGRAAAAAGCQLVGGAGAGCAARLAEARRPGAAERGQLQGCALGEAGYTFDVTKCMFSPGNITEKLRVASLPCSGEVVVDLYAGIGYFTLPFLVHAGAAFVHACEWNSHAVEALHRTLVLNGVRDRCHIHAGDSRQLQLRDVADRVNLGLIPSSEEGWPVACRVLKKDRGGVLHIHHNVETPPALRAERGSPEPQHPTEDGGEETLGARLRPEWQRWAEATATRIQGLLAELHGRPWSTRVLHVEAVKSYAPHVHHLVLDLKCRPVLPLQQAVGTAGAPAPLEG
ncbi:tRNA wybutosine-synthesizing protein 2 homolog isoform X7 [Sylvia atricapilla]|uniref:tRNA wybutosine-synthesizing protein 2 homolog isoform X7 n=1 Tax=Sylvia atricapilla TaxID=48155 RepID=UPI0033984657